MKPYQNKRLEGWPDVGDIHAEGRKSSCGNLQGKSGEIRSIHKSSEKKRAARRNLKRSDKAKNKIEEDY